MSHVPVARAGRTARLSCLTSFVLAAALCLAPAALAGTATHVLRAHENYDVYSFVPGGSGNIEVTLSWTGPDGTGAPVWPVAEVDDVVQLYLPTTGESYGVAEPTVPAMQTNPRYEVVHVGLLQAHQAVFVSVAPWVGDVPYRLVVKFAGSTVIDTGPIDVGNAAQRWAHGSWGQVYVPARGAWHSVLQYWPGSLDRDNLESDVVANWDDFVGSPFGFIAANGSVEYVSPVVTDSVLGAAPDPADAPAWFVVAPQIWTSAERPNRWENPFDDLYPKPGNVSPGDASAWYTYAFPDGTSAPSRPCYFLNEGPLSDLAVGGSYWVTSSITQQVQFAFVGSSLTWDYLRTPAGALVDVTISGMGEGPDHYDLVDLVDQYAPTPAPTSTTWTGLGAGAHVVTLQSSGQHSAGSTGYNFYHDAFEATTDAADLAPLADNATDGSTWARWNRQSSAGFFGGTQSSSSALGAACAFTFQGAAIDLVYTKSIVGGTARVRIDGVDEGTVAMYAATPVFQAMKSYTGLPGGASAWHTIFVTNDKTTSGAGYYIYVDAFRVGGVTYDDAP